MKRKSAVLFLVMSVFFANASWAQNSMGRSSVIASSMSPKRANRLVLDGAPILIKGVGLSYARALGSNWVFGPRAEMFQLSSDETTILTQKHKITRYGLEGRYFFRGAESNSLYVMGALMNTQLESTAQFGTTKEGSASTSQVGPMAGMGYQGAFKAGSDFIFNIGGMYGSGYAVSVLAQSKFSSNATTVSDPQIRSSLFLEATVGMLF